MQVATIKRGNREFGLVQCVVCGEPRYRRMYYVLTIDKHFCSRKCAIEARKLGIHGAPLKSIVGICAVCQVSVTRKPSEVSKSGLLFCSHPCVAKGVRLGLVSTNPIKSHSKGAGRQRARYKFKEDAPCEICGKPSSQRHHKDGNTSNNSAENIARLCPKHHTHADRLDHMSKIQPIGTLKSIQGAVRNSTGRFVKRTGTPITNTDVKEGV